MIYPDEEKITYSYNLGGQLEKVHSLLQIQVERDAISSAAAALETTAAAALAAAGRALEAPETSTWRANPTAQTEKLIGT